MVLMFADAKGNKLFEFTLKVKRLNIFELSKKVSVKKCEHFMNMNWKFSIFLYFSLSCHLFNFFFYLCYFLNFFFQFGYFNNFLCFMNFFQGFEAFRTRKSKRLINSTIFGGFLILTSSLCVHSSYLNELYLKKIIKLLFSVQKLKSCNKFILSVSKTSFSSPSCFLPYKNFVR